MKSWSTWARG